MKKSNSAGFLIVMGVMVFLGFGVNFIDVLKERNILMMFVYGPLTVVGVAMVVRGVVNWRRKGPKNEDSGPVKSA